MNTNTTILVRAASIKPERVNWAWQERIPIGMATLLVGLGGLGKSLLLCWLAAGWSRGTIPGVFFGTPIHVAIASAEDHRQSVILPRLLAAGADLTYIHFVEQRIDGEATDIEINGEVADLENTLRAGEVRALLIDTIIAHIPSQHDSYKEQHVRRVLKPLSKMAERLDMVFVGAMHLNRRDAPDVLTRISGSGAFGNLARSVLLFANDPDDREGSTRVLAVGKTNVGGTGPTVKMKIETYRVPQDDGSEIATARLVDAGVSEFTSSQLLAPPEDEDARSALAQAEDFLKEILDGGKLVDANMVKKLAKDAGISVRTLWRAAKKLGVKTNNRAGFGQGYASRWSLPCQEFPSVPVSTEGTLGNDWHGRDPDNRELDLADGSSPKTNEELLEAAVATFRVGRPTSVTDDPTDHA